MRAISERLRDASCGGATQIDDLDLDLDVFGNGGCDKQLDKQLDFGSDLDRDTGLRVL